MDAKVVRTFILGLLAVCLATLLGIYHVWQNHRHVTLGGELSHSSQELRKLRTENELLEAEYRTLRSSEQFDQRAFSRLRMKQPSSLDTIYVESYGAGNGAEGGNR